MLDTQHGAIVQGSCTAQYQVHNCVCPQQPISDNKEKRVAEQKIYNNERLVRGLYTAAPKQYNNHYATEHTLIFFAPHFLTMDTTALIVRAGNATTRESSKAGVGYSVDNVCD